MNPMLPDDTESLRRYIPGGHFDYRDISSERARQRARERWPLLAEVANRRAPQEPARSTLPQQAAAHGG